MGATSSLRSSPSARSERTATIRTVADTQATAIGGYADHGCGDLRTSRVSVSAHRRCDQLPSDNSTRRRSQSSGRDCAPPTHARAARRTEAARARGASVLECSLGAFMIETIIERQRLDDPATKAELVEPRERQTNTGSRHTPVKPLGPVAEARRVTCHNDVPDRAFERPWNDGGLLPQSADRPLRLVAPRRGEDRQAHRKLRLVHPRVRADELRPDRNFSGGSDSAPVGASSGGSSAVSQAFARG